MKKIGLFEAKTRLSEICAEVAEENQGVIVTRRGEPLVEIRPIAKAGQSIWEARDAYVGSKGLWKKDLTPPERTLDNPPIWT